jgi:hypothetical protein
LTAQRKKKKKMKKLRDFQRAVAAYRLLGLKQNADTRKQRELSSWQLKWNGQRPHTNYSQACT